MKHDLPGMPGLNYALCRYGTSRMFFRGPRRPMDGQYISFIGSTETYGKFIPEPFPELVERHLGVPCVNLGSVNASIDAFRGESALQAICNEATVNVVQIMPAHNMSNRFYTVHPRRNDRFLRASTVLSAIYPEVDFTDFCFTRHMLSRLLEHGQDRFAIVREELQTAWVARMRSFLTGIGPRTFLLWLGEHLPSDNLPEAQEDPLGRDPLFVTRKMIEALRPMVRGVVMAPPSSRAQALRTEGMVFGKSQEVAAASMLGPLAHQEIAEALASALGPTFGMDQGSEVA